MKRIFVEYFALLAQEVGKSKEEFTTTASSVDELFVELKGLYAFSLSEKQIKATLNNQLISSWQTPLSDGDHLLLLVPLAGG